MKQPAISIPLLVKNVIEMIQGSNNENWFVCLKPVKPTRKRLLKQTLLEKKNQVTTTMVIHPEVVDGHLTYLIIMYERTK